MSSSSSQNDQKAITISKFAADGNWNDCIEESRLPIPKPSKSNKVIVKVHETALNPIDRKLVRGYVQMVFPRKFPFVVGFDFSGVVTAVGADVRHVKVGDAVFGCVNLVENFGAQAEYTEVDDFTVCKMPEGISFRDAATTTMTFITAHAVLYKVAKLKAGQQILVLGGAGATGVFAIQLAKFLGAKVVTTASAANTDYVKSLGADSVINYKETNWWKSDSLKESFDVIFDTAGEKDTWDRCLPLMKPRSHFVAITSPLIENQMTVSTMLSMVSNMAYFGVRNLFSSRRYDLYFSDCKIEEAMRLFNQLYTEGKIKTLRVDSVYPFSKEGAVQMLDKSKKGNPQGKLVMHIA